MSSPTEIVAFLAENDVPFVDCRFSDILGREHHLTIPADRFDEDTIEGGIPFDGSSMPGWKGVEASDMLLVPDLRSLRFDPFREERTVVFTCTVVDPVDLNGYERDPRSLAQRAETYLRSTGLGDTAYFGPEPEFFVFDGVRWGDNMSGNFVEIQSESAPWATQHGPAEQPGYRNLGHRPGLKGGYTRVPPIDAFHDMRSEMCLLLEQQGVPVEIHHHEVAAAGQLEIGTRFSTLVERADWNQIFKYTVFNVAQLYGKTATFMPKPLYGDNGSGMHVHQSIWKDGENLFSGNGYGGLSDMALYYIGGIIKHAHALNALTNPTTNSYKRLLLPHESPVKLAYSARNRSASIRIPYVTAPHARRVEARFPDAIANPYLAFSALLMAGLDGIENRIHPGDPADKNLYDLPPEEDAKIPTVCTSLEQALQSLDDDRDFLLRGGVFTDPLIDAFIELKEQEVNRLRTTPHPAEFDMYYSL